jgi:ATP-dependent helicase/nuclease subunit A
MLLESADSLVDAGFDSLPDFVRWLRDQSEEPRAEGLGETEPGADGGVQILTMHKAKGLEFPIVLVADLAGEPRQESGLIVDRGRGAIEFRVSRKNGIATPEYDAAQKSERERRNAEDVRLLYVAMTRARDRLIVSWPEGKGGFLRDGRLEKAIGAPPGQAPAEEPDGRLALLRTEQLPEQPERRRLLTVDTDRPRIPRGPDPEPEPAAGKGAGRGRRTLRVTDLTPASRVSGPPPADPDGAFRGRTFGRLIHSALELAGPEADAEALAARAAARLEGALAREGNRLPPDLLAEAIPYLRRVLADPAVSALWRAPRVLREVPFLLPLGDDLLSGTLDAVVEGTGGGLTILDWKTDQLGARSAQDARDRYRPQALAYAWAAARLTGRRILEVRFVFLSRSPVETASFDVDDDFLLQARARLGTAARDRGIPGAPGMEGI